MRVLRVASLLSLCLPIAAPAQTATPTAFLTTVGKDTFCLEQYSRSGNVISGTWTVMHPPGVYVHDYKITLDKDGLPARYVMVYSTPGAPTRPDLDSLTVTYGKDSASLVFFNRDSTDRRRIAMHEAFPLLGQSFVGVELALMRLERMHVDSSSITLHPPSEPDRPVSVLPVRLVGDSAFAGGIRIRVAKDGSILGLTAGRAELRRVEPFEMSKLVDGFVKAYAPQAAATAAAIAARKEIPLPSTELDRFAGDYSIVGVTAHVARDGEHLLLTLPQQRPVPLLAMSPTEFFVKGADVVVTFERDAAGHVTGFVFAQSGNKQRAARLN